jgi:hypothetical protein
VTAVATHLTAVVTRDNLSSRSGELDGLDEKSRAKADDLLKGSEPNEQELPVPDILGKFQLFGLASGTARQLWIVLQTAEPWLTEGKAKKYNLTKLKSGLWVQVTASKDDRTPRLVVPTLLRETVLKACHDVSSAGHPGVNRMLALLQKQFWWPGYRADVVRYVRTCASCQRNKSATAKPVGKLTPLPVPTQPWESISMDFITELPKTATGHDTLFVVVDRFSKMVHLAPCHSSLTASQAADLLIDLVFKLHGTPSSFISDRDKLWTSEFFARWCSKLQVHLNLSSAYHPQTDGQTERMNRLLQEVLRHYVAPAHDNWDQLLPLAEFAINRAVNASTGKSPFVVVYGYQPHAPLDRFYQLLTTTTPVTKASVRTAANEADSKLRDHQAEFAKIAELLRRAQQAQKEQFDKRRRRAPDYAVGDKVWVDCKILRIVTVGTPKFLQRWQGPYTITKVIKTRSSNEVTAVTLDIPKHWKVFPTFHVSVVKPYPPNTREAPTPSTVVVEGHEEFVVEEILDHRFIGRNRKLQFLVKWAGYSADHNLWTDEDDLTSDGQYQNSAITQYWAKLAEKAVKEGTLPTPSALAAHKPEAKAMRAKSKKQQKPKLARSTQPAWKRLAEQEASAPPAKRRRYATRAKGAPESL